MMMPEERCKVKALERIILDEEEVVIAVSGGIDSMALAMLASSVLGDRCRMVHAVSPAVPQAAYERVKSYAEKYGWNILYENVKELDSPDYKKNPVNRCYYCKSKLYGFLRTLQRKNMFSGANVDDLGDFRPGLIAAQENDIRHPYIEVGMTKDDIRKLAEDIGLHDLKDLPASPCLSSRVETGIAIQGEMLRRIDKVEEALRSVLGSKNLRCRIRVNGVVIEMDTWSLEALQLDQRSSIKNIVEEVFGEPPVALNPYEMGSAFIREENNI